MQLSFHGAARTVTGSKHLLELQNGKKILLDCGLFQGLGKQTEQLNVHFGFDASTIDALILSHAHIDHSGLIPKLVKEGFKGKIFCTPATYDLTKILLQDSAIIQHDDLKYINKKRAKLHLPAIVPLYSLDDVQHSFLLLDKQEYKHWFKVVDGVEAMFTDAGHIIGSAAIHLKITENNVQKSLTFSGDVGRYHDIILRSPDVFPQADYIIIESTYGNSLHDTIKSPYDVLQLCIQATCVQKKGKLIIPSFSVGRTQELLYILNILSNEKRLPKIPVFVDSPLSKDATDIVKSYPKYFNSKVSKLLLTDEDPFSFEGLTFIQNVEESKALNNNLQPMIIISASGMADAGRVKHHIANNLHDAKNTILLVGYCEPNSLGGRLMNHQQEVRIFGEYFKVVAEIASMRSLSAHGDYEDLMSFLSCQNSAQVKKIFIVHGEENVQYDFMKKLANKGFKEIVIPYLHEVFII